MDIRDALVSFFNEALSHPEHYSKTGEEIVDYVKKLETRVHELESETFWKPVDVPSMTLGEMRTLWEGKRCFFKTNLDTIFCGYFEVEEEDVIYPTTPKYWFPNIVDVDGDILVETDDLNIIVEYALIPGEELRNLHELEKEVMNHDTTEKKPYAPPVVFDDDEDNFEETYDHDW